VTTLAFNLFLRQRRRIAFWVLAVVGVGLMALPFLPVLIHGPASLEEQGAKAALAGAGCWLAAILALLLAVGLSQGSVSQDLSRSTVHLVLVRPVSRRQYMAGMFLGSALTSLSLYLAFALTCWLGVAVCVQAHLLGTLMALVVLAVPVLLITLLVTLLSAWMPGSAAGIIGYASFIFGLFSGTLEEVAEKLHPFWGSLIRGVNLISLRLDRVFGLAGNIVEGNAVSWWPLAWEAGYAFVVVLLGIMLFERRKV